MSQQSKLAIQSPKRLNAMIKRSEDFQTQFQSEEPIYKLLGEFTAFSREYIELLAKVPETISRNSFVVNNGIEKLLQEWNILSRASEQRLIGSLKGDLDQASNLAKTYCDKWNDILRDKPYQKLAPPVVYFEKLFRISRSIYAPQIPVISIPLKERPVSATTGGQGCALEQLAGGGFCRCLWHSVGRFILCNLRPGQDGRTG